VLGQDSEVEGADAGVGLTAVAALAGLNRDDFSELWLAKF
jgi:hypothetical protein